MVYNSLVFLSGDCCMVYVIPLQSCRNFNDSGTCVKYCPPERVYNSITWQWEENPHAKFAYHNTCIKDCRTGKSTANKPTVKRSLFC